jgi:hypothetical protein
LPCFLVLWLFVENELTGPSSVTGTGTEEEKKNKNLLFFCEDADGEHRKGG